MEGLPIQGIGPAPTLDELAKTSVVAAQGPVIDHGLSGAPILGNIPVDSPAMFRMTQDSLHGCVDASLKASGLEPTPANLEKIMNNLIMKFNDWVKSGDFVVKDISSREAGQAYLDQACLRLGLPNNSDSYAKIIKGLTK